MNEDKIKTILENGNVPLHVAIIMDGNGRWAKSRGLPRVAGHNEGINSVREIVKLSSRLGIEILTLYTFSSENWSRPATEVSALMKLLLRTIRSEVEDLHENNVKVLSIGQLEDLPESPRKGIEEAIEKTRNNTGLKLNLALSYSSRLEILTALKQISGMVKNDEIGIADIDEKLFSDNLHTKGMRDPDLMIRTSGESRISNFLLWQIAYTEIYIADTLWPSFRENEFLAAIEDYQKRERRFGLVSEQVN
ncbi:MAG: isoprenyl transferase [bacterium]|nr:isoprenyl transferase [bacterium]